MFAAGVELAFIPAAKNPDRKGEPKKKRPVSGLPLGDQLIRLEGRELTKVPENVYTARPHLKTLILSRNFITELPMEISRLTKLTTLNLSNNCLERLPAEIGALGSLQSLILEKNKLRDLPTECAYLFSLKVLDLRGNPLDKQIGGRSLRDVWDAVPDEECTGVLEERTGAMLAHIRSGLDQEERRKVDAKLASLEKRGLARALDRAARLGDEAILDAALVAALKAGLVGEVTARAQVAATILSDLRKAVEAGDLGQVQAALTHWWARGGGEEGALVQEAAAAERRLRHEAMQADLARRAALMRQSRRHSAPEGGGCDASPALDEAGGGDDLGTIAEESGPEPPSYLKGTAARFFAAAPRVPLANLKHNKSYSSWVEEKKEKKKESRVGLKEFIAQQAQERRAAVAAEERMEQQARARESRWLDISVAPHDSPLEKAPPRGGGGGGARAQSARGAARRSGGGGGGGGGDGDSPVDVNEGDQGAAVEGSAFERRQKYWLQHRRTLRAQSAPPRRDVGRGGGRGPLLLGYTEGDDEYGVDDDWEGDGEGEEEAASPPEWRPMGRSSLPRGIA